MYHIVELAYLFEKDGDLDIDDGLKYLKTLSDKEEAIQLVKELQRSLKDDEAENTYDLMDKAWIFIDDLNKDRFKLIIDEIISVDFDCNTCERRAIFTDIRYPGKYFEALYEEEEYTSIFDLEDNIKIKEVKPTNKTITIYE